MVEANLTNKITECVCKKGLPTLRDLWKGNLVWKKKKENHTESLCESYDPQTDLTFLVIVHLVQLEKDFFLYLNCFSAVAEMYLPI